MTPEDTSDYDLADKDIVDIGADLLIKCAARYVFFLDNRFCVKVNGEDGFYPPSSHQKNLAEIMNGDTAENTELLEGYLLPVRAFLENHKKSILFFSVDGSASAL